MTPRIRTRLAPSPTGYLHLGHVLHMIWLYSVARELNAQILFRMEDHDQSRCKPEFEKSIIEDTRWLEPILPGQVESSELLWRQSRRRPRYQEVFDGLNQAGLVYACICSRQEIATATGQTSGELHYPGTCRHKNIPFDQPGVAWRLRLSDQVYETEDFRHGKITQNPSRMGGDMVIRDKAGHWTYQFCVVIDDIDQNINLIIRGDDLLSSVGRQMAMREILLRYTQTTPLQPTNKLYFLHHPLLIDETGHKLSKRFLSESISSLREDGLDAKQVVAEAAHKGNLLLSENLPDPNNIASLIPEEIVLRAKKGFQLL